MDMNEPTEPDDRQLLITDDGGGQTVLALRGEIDLSNVDHLSRAIDARLKPADRVVFDLSGVEFMDTSGIALLLTTVNSVAEAEIRAPSRQVRRVLEATGLTSVLRISP
jgi:anti-sigma B factor antagonist